MLARRKLLIIQDIVTILFQQSFGHLSENFTGDRSISYGNEINIYISTSFIRIPLSICFTDFASPFTLLTMKSCRKNTNKINLLRDSHCKSCQSEDNSGGKNQRASPLTRGLALLVDSLLEGRRGISSSLTSVSRSRYRPIRLPTIAMMQAQVQVQKPAARSECLRS